MPSVRKESAPREHSPGPKLLAGENGADLGGLESNINRSNSSTSVKLSETDEPELLANNPQQRNWRGIILALLVIVILSSIIITASILTTPREQPDDFGKPYSFSDLIHLNQLMHYLSYHIHKDALVYLSGNYDLIHINVSTMEQGVILSHLTVEEKLRYTELFSMSPDLSAVLLQYDVKQENRYSQPSKYDALLLPNPVNGLQSVEKRIEVGPDPNSADQPQLPFVQWSPKHNHLAFAYNNHVYIHLHPFKESLSTIVNVTQGMPDNDIQYGQADWLYEEELLQTNVALWWNPTATRLAFASFDERNVSTAEIYRYDLGNGLFGGTTRHKYPKVGDSPKYGNPVVNLFMYDLETKERRQFPRPDPVPWDGNLVFIRWYDEDKMLACWTNRIQSEAWITVVSWSRKKSHVIFKTRAEDGWVDMLKETSIEPIVHHQSQNLFIILPRDYSERAYRGIARLRVELDRSEVLQTPKWLITPEFDILDILYYDDHDGFIFSATGPDPKNLHVYWGSSTSEQFCLTCGNPNCTYNKARVFQYGKYFVLECRGPDVPTYALRSINITRNSLGAVQTVESHHVLTLLDNAVFKQQVQSRALPRTQYINLTLREGTRDQLQVEGKLLIPLELNRSHITKYPLLLYTYGGPAKQLVTTKFALDWTTYLAATIRVVVLSVDGRGSSGRGRRFEHHIYRKLGVVEVEDQLDAIKALIKTVRFVNESQIGAYGWSYGGFTVGHLLGHPENDVIRCGISVAPVTDFKYYDTAYTERYMGRLADHPEAYARTEIARNARNMRSKSILLIHGTADDNVHLINSVTLTKALMGANVDVDVMLYPDANHFIQKAFSREHLFRKLTTFLIDCFNKTSIRYSLDMSVRGDL